MASKEQYSFEMVTTRGGDGGKTSLLGGEFVFKSDFRFELMGSIDELTSYLGVCRREITDRSVPECDRFDGELREIQNTLYRIMSILALNGISLPADTFDETYAMLSPVTESDIETMEGWEHFYLDAVTIEPRFIIPGDRSTAAAHLDFSRTLARRAERNIVSLIQDHNGGAYRNAADLFLSQRYVNRLSDYLFVLARYIDEIV